jgi:methylmalonyl-CoA/ethylmalonyl-CoA epimerase
MKKILKKDFNMKNNQQGIGTLCQIGIIVKDIEVTVKRFSRILDLPVPEIIISEPEEIAHTRYRRNSTNARAKLAFFPIGQVTIELIEPVGGPSTWRDHLEGKGEGIHHIAFHVEDSDETCKHLAESNVTVVQQGDYTGGRYTYCEGECLSGVMLELLEDVER